MGPRELEQVKPQLVNLRQLALETSLPELVRIVFVYLKVFQRDHWRRYETSLQRISTEVIPQLLTSLDRRAWREAEQQLGYLETIRELLKADPFTQVLVKAEELCRECLLHINTATNLLTFAAYLAETSTLQTRFGRILPTGFTNIHDQCLAAARVRSELFRENFTELIEANDFAIIAGELELVARGVESCKGFLDFSSFQSEVIELVRQQARKNNLLVKQFLREWNIDYGQAPKLLIEEIPTGNLFEPVPLELVRADSFVAVPDEIPTPTMRAKVKPNLSQVENSEDDKAGVVMLEGRKKISEEVKVGGKFGHKVEWSFAIPDGNRVNFTVSFRDSKAGSKLSTIAQVVCATHMGKHELSTKAEGVIIFTWENKTSNLLKSPKPAQIVYAIKVCNKAVSIPPPPPLTATTVIPRDSSLLLSEEKIQDPFWVATTTDELMLLDDDQSGAPCITLTLATLAAFRAISGYQYQIFVGSPLGEDTIEGIMAFRAFSADVALRFAALQEAWKDKNFSYLSENSWRVRVLCRFLNPELKDIVQENQRFYQVLVSAALQHLLQCSSNARKSPPPQVMQDENLAHAWLTLHLSNQADLQDLLIHARRKVLDRLGRFFRDLPGLSFKNLATQFVDQVVPFRARYPLVVAALLKNVTQRFLSQMLANEINPVSEASLLITENIYHGILQLQNSQHYAEIQEDVNEIVDGYKKLLKRIDCVLLDMSTDPHLRKHLPDALFLAFATFSRLSASDKSSDFVYGKAILDQLVSDPLLTDQLSAFTRWAKANHPEWFQCIVVLVDQVAPRQQDLIALFPSLFSFKKNTIACF